MKKCAVLAFLFCSQIYAQEEVANKNAEPHFWIEGEYLGWWVKHSPEPVPLIEEELIGPLLLSMDEPDSQLVLGEKDFKLGARPGARISLGGWLNDHIGLAGSYLILPEKSKKASVSSNGQIESPFLVLPFFDVTTDSESLALIADPGQYSGWAQEKIENDMSGAEADILGRVYARNGLNINVLAGFRWWNFNEKFTLETSSPNISPPFDIMQTQDSFQTRNNFYGGQVGFDTRFTWKRVSVETTGKIALGAMDSSVNIKGNFLTNSFSNFNEIQSFPAGYFALPTNEGKASKTRFSILPEIDINLGFQLAKWIDLKLGYTFLYVTNVVWAGNTIDRNLNPSQAPAITMTPSTELVGAPFPKPLLKTEGFWVQGFNLGITFSY